jgi:hypothetical protein
MAANDGAVEVRLLGVPVTTYLANQERMQELLREFTLIAYSQQAEPTGPSSVPARLVALADDLRGRYGPNDVDEQIAAAAADGDPSVDLTLPVPVNALADVVRVDELLQEAEEFCRAEHLLTLAAAEDERRFLRWYLGEIVRQLDGASPTPFSST